MRVLWVSPHHPDPAGGGGSAHEFQLLRSASERHDIRLITSYTGRAIDESPLPGLGVDVVPSVVHPHPSNRLGVARAMIRARPTLLLWLLRERWKDLSAAVARAQDAIRPDLVHVSLGELAPVLGAARGPTSLLLFDSYTRHVERRLAVEPLLRRRLQLRMEQRRAASWERQWYGKAGAIASVSNVDAERFRDLLGRDVTVIENPIADEYFEPPAVSRRTDTVLFVGSLAYPPNTDAIEWITRDIWPSVLRHRPDARLVIVGRADGDVVTVPRVRALVEAAGGTFAVDVPDVRPYYWEATVVIAPLRLGAGLRNKVIHAMACRAPVVATPAALEGIAVAAGQHALVASTADTFASAVVEAMNQPEASARRVAAAAGVMERYRAGVIGERFEQWWQSALPNSRQ
jgi:glycosyltransferase involved in cell wall biosynthesis